MARRRVDSEDQEGLPDPDLALVGVSDENERFDLSPKRLRPAGWSPGSTRMNSGRTHTVAAFPGEAAIFFSQTMGPIAESILVNAILHTGHFPLDEVRAADEIRDEPPIRFEVDLPGRPHLDDPAAPHHRDRVRERQGLDPVVGHIDGGDRKLREKTPQLLARLLAELGVQVGEGLVEEDHLRLGNQGPGQGDALLLARR